MTTDPDGDSQMASSPESAHSFSDMDAGSRTPTQQVQTTGPQFASVSELSPPGSQPQPTGGMIDTTKGSSGAEGWVGESRQHPGASWMNKRAEEEYQRAMDHPDENKIHFTPVKSSQVPRVWDRKPSISFLARSKPRKVWKRFRTSFNSMKALQQLIAPDASSPKESELLLEINTRENADYCRGVKRQCLIVQKFSGEHDGATPPGRGRSFLETKWESEVSRKRRKLPVARNSMDEHLNSDDRQDDEDEDMAAVGELPGGTTSNGNSAVQEPEEAGESPTNTPRPCAVGAAYPDALHSEPDCLKNKKRGASANINTLDFVAQDGFRDFAPTDAAGGAAATDDALDVATAAHDGELRPDVATITSYADRKVTMAVPVGMSAAQESTLIRSALRSSMDGDDTALLNDFLSKAKAKREAKAAAETEAAATIIASDPEEKEPEQPPRHQASVEIPTPERRVLEDLDANTSSPQKSPSKPDEKNESVGDKDSASPVARRSTRVRLLQRAVAPSFRTTLSLRRARGNEFVFLQRTEAQEMALATRRNTKQNKGDALMPKFKLQELARQTPDSYPNTVNDGTRKSNKPKKYVKWNEERLVEYEGDGPGSDDDLSGGSQALKATTTLNPKLAEKKKGAASSGRSSVSHESLKTGAGVQPEAAAAATTASPTATRARRVRRLGPPKPLESAVVTDSNDSASSPPSPTTIVGSTPIAKRKKLTPKSPKTSLSRTASKVPTAAAAATNTTELPSLLSGGRSVKANLLKVNAGSTPKPRRVRRA
ncbi:hypothetical protein BDW75DRAFT_242812 [Aspergillus navahoensis]